MLYFESLMRTLGEWKLGLVLVRLSSAPKLTLSSHPPRPVHFPLGSLTHPPVQSQPPFSSVPCIFHTILQADFCEVRPIHGKHIIDCFQFFVTLTSTAGANSHQNKQPAYRLNHLIEDFHCGESLIAFCNIFLSSDGGARRVLISQKQRR